MLSTPGSSTDALSSSADVPATISALAGVGDREFAEGALRFGGQRQTERPRQPHGAQQERGTQGDGRPERRAD